MHCSMSTQSISLFFACYGWDHLSFNFAAGLGMAYGFVFFRCNVQDRSRQPRIDFLHDTASHCGCRSHIPLWFCLLRFASTFSSIPVFLDGSNSGWWSWVDCFSRWSSVLLDGLDVSIRPTRAFGIFHRGFPLPLVAHFFWGVWIGSRSHAMDTPRFGSCVDGE